MTQPLYLASTSPRRREIIESIGLRFRVLAPAADPPPDDGATPERHALDSALAKALSVRRRVRTGWIVGVDTVVALRGSILGKPADRDDARRMLKALSGRTHRVISGVAVVRRPGDRVFSATETSLVRFRRLADRDIGSYLNTDEPYDKAGAYGIQGRAGRFISSVTGSYLNVVGLPALTMLRLLVAAGYRL